MTHWLIWHINTLHSLSKSSPCFAITSSFNWKVRLQVKFIWKLFLSFRKHCRGIVNMSYAQRLMGLETFLFQKKGWGQHNDCLLCENLSSSIHGRWPRLHHVTITLWQQDILYHAIFNWCSLQRSSVKLTKLLVRCLSAPWKSFSSGWGSIHTRSLALGFLTSTRLRTQSTVAHKDKTLPEIQNTSTNHKTLPEIQNTSTNHKTLPVIQNTSTNHKTLPQIQMNGPIVSF